MNKQEKKAFKELINDLHKHNYKGSNLGFNETIELIKGYEKVYIKESYNLKVTPKVIKNVLIELVKNFKKYA